jgi:hypothetical protein
VPTTRSRRPGEARYSDRILEQLLKLRSVHALPLRELETPAGLHRFQFRAAGWPVQVDLDETVLEMRVYTGRQTIATGRVAPEVMSAVLGRTPIDAGGAVSADDCIAALREIVGDWRSRNARVHMEPPRVARHPDGWNNA